MMPPSVVVNVNPMYDALVCLVYGLEFESQLEWLSLAFQAWSFTFAQPYIIIDGSSLELVSFADRPKTNCTNKT